MLRVQKGQRSGTVRPPPAAVEVEIKHPCELAAFLSNDCLWFRVDFLFGQDDVCDTAVVVKDVRRLFTELCQLCLFSYHQAVVQDDKYTANQTAPCIKSVPSSLSRLHDHNNPTTGSKRIREKCDHRKTFQCIIGLLYTCTYAAT